MPVKTAKRLWTYLVIVLLALVCALNYNLFVFPNRFAPAGLNGICTMIQYVTGINVGYLSLLINIPLALLVLVKVGRSLALRSMLYVTAFSLFLIALEKADLSRFVYDTAGGTSRILGPLAAGVIYGACASLLVRCSCSSGGTDFVAAIIHRSHPEQSFFWITFSINTVVAVSSYFVYDFEIEPVILCILYSFMSSTVSDHLMKGFRSAVRFEIITDDPDEIAEAIIQRLHHSATLVPARGMYLGRETSVLICIINKAQAPALADILQDYPGAFAVMSGVNEVVGNFKRMTPKGKLERELLDKGDGKTA